MLLFQIPIIIFFIFAIIKVIVRYKQSNLKFGDMVLWVIFWLVGIIVVAIPNSTFYFSKQLGIGRGADLVVYVALALLFFIIFRMTVRLERMEKNITKIVRKEAFTVKAGQVKKEE